MSEAQANHPWRLPRRDYILLPLIFVMTALVVLAGGEVSVRLIYVQDDAAEPCAYSTPFGFRFKPLCTSQTKVWEGPWITQHFNECGYRTAESCAPRPSGMPRIVVVGSSVARGALVNYPQSFAARASAVLTDRCRTMVDFQNLGTNPSDFDRIDQRIPEALALKPSAIVMTTSPFDLMHQKDPPPDQEHKELPARIDLRSMVSILRESRLFMVLQYYLYRDPLFHIRSFLRNGDSADYVRRPLSAAWRQRLADLGDLLGRITSLTAPTHVPLLLFYVPDRAQAALAAFGSDLPNVDPMVLGEALEKVAAARSVRFFDTTRAFAAAPDFQSLFYLTDGHARDGGHAALAAVVEEALLSEPAFANCRQERSSQSALGR